MPKANYDVEAAGLNEPLKDSLRVLVVSDYMPPQTHGICTHCKDLVEWLRHEGCIVHVFTTCGEASEDRSLLWAFPNPFNPLVKTAFWPSLRLLWCCLFGDWDVIHILYPSLVGWPVILLGYLSGKTIYISHHCKEELGRLYLPAPIYYMALLSSLMVAMLPAYLFGTINAGATPGYNQEHYLWRRLPAERVAVVPSSIDARLFHPEGRSTDRAALRKSLGLGDRVPLWLVVSRLAVEKRIPLVLDALRRHRELFPQEEQPVLVIAGDGPVRSELEAQAKRDGVRVEFLGFVKHAEVPKLYRGSDACVTCSVQETFGLTVIEAMGCGCPQVLPHCDVFNELYGNVISDWMFEAQSVDGLAQAMHSAASEKAARHLEDLKRSGSFGPHIFWSWRAAALDQIDQYRQGMKIRARSCFRCCRRRRK